MAEEDFVTIGIQGDVDPLVREIQAGLERALGNFAGDFSRELANIFTKGLSGSRKFQQSVDDIGETSKRVFSQAAKQAESFDKAMGGISQSLSQVNSKLNANSFDAAGQGFSKLIGLGEKFESQFDRISRDDGANRLAATQTQAFRSAANTANISLQEVNRAVQTSERQKAEAIRVGEQRATALAVAGSKERIVAAQQEGAQSLAAIRASSAQRVAIIKGLGTAVRGLEEGFNRIISGGSSVLGRGITGVSSIFAGLTRAAKSSNSEISAGLSTALNKRESILRQSFSKQESIVRESLSRTARTQERFNAVTAGGVAGLASGRSNAANALGIGGVLSGGFLIFNQLKEGIKGAQDFRQTMAVLQAQLQLTDGQMKAIRDTSIQLGNDLSLPGVSATDAGAAIALLAKQFGSLGDQAAPAATAAAKGVLQLSRATSASAEDSAQIVGSAINVFGINADRAVTVADSVTAALSKAAGTSTTEFAQAFAQGAGVFNLFQGQALGAEGALTEFNAALAILARNGRTGSDAGTSLKQLFLNGTRQVDGVTEKTKQLAESVGETGSVFFKADGSARAFSASIDILRRSTATMTEEQRNSTLALLFGTDAVTTAGALIGTTAEEYDALVASLQREGVAAELAAAQNQGLRGAMDALGSVIDTQILLAFEKLDEPLGKAVTAVAEFVNVLASGEGVFANVRTALKGVAIALGGLLALKTVIEVVQLLAIGFGALLTPVGLLIAGVGLAGGAIALLAKNSEGFRDFLDSAKNKAIELGTAGIDFLKEKFEQLQGFITGSVIPAVMNLADIVKTNVLAGFQVVSNFIRQTVIPALQRFADFITSTAVPAIRDGLGRAFEIASDAISSFWGVVQPVLQPAIDGIGSLVTAIGTLARTNVGTALLSLGGIIAAAVGGFALGGPVGAVIAGAGATVAALFANGLQDNLFDALSGIGATIGDAFSNLGGVVSRAFSSLIDKIDFGALVGRAFEATSIAQTVGKAIGGILSSPQLVAGAAGIAAFAAAVAVQFGIGFTRGIVENIPDLVGLLGDALEAGLSAINIPFGDVVSKLLLGGTALAGVLVAFKKLGTSANGAFVQGFAGNGAGVNTGTGPRSFLQGLVGGAALESGIRADAQRVAKTFNDEFARSNRLLQANNKSPIISESYAFGGVTPGDTERVRKAVADLNAELGNSRTQGRFAADAFGRLKSSIGSLDFSGAKTALSDLGTVLKTNGRDIATAAGVAIGASFGVAIGVGMVANSKDIGGKLQGVLTIAGSAAAAFAVGGPVLGAVSLGLGTLGALFEGIGKKAKESAERVGAFAEAIKKSADAGDLIGNVGPLIQAQLEKSLNNLDINTLLDKGFDLKAFTKRLTTQGSTLRQEFDKLFSGFGPASKNFIATLDPAVDSLEELRLAFSNRGAQSATFARELQQAGIDTDDFNAILGVLNGTIKDYGKSVDEAATSNRLTAQLDAAGASADKTGEKVKAYRDSLQSLNEEPTYSIENINELIKKTPGYMDAAKAAADRFFGTGGQTTLQGALDDFTLSLPNLADRFGELNAEGLQPILKSALEGQLNNDIQLQLKGLIKVGITEGNVEASPEGIAAFLAGVKAQVQAAMDQGAIPLDVGLKIIAQVNALEQSPDLLAAVQAAVDSGAVPEANIPVKINPQFTVDAGAGAAIGAALNAAFANSSGGTTAGNRGAAQGFAAGGQYGRSSGGGGTAISVPVTLTPVITMNTSGATVAGTQLAVAFAAAVAAGRIAATVAAASLSIAAGAQFGAAVGQAAASGRQLATSFAAGITSGIGTAVGAARALGAAASGAVRASTDTAVSAGRQIAGGLAAGINSGAGAAISAARNMAAQVTAATRSALKISSPSKVFAEIGENIGKGLAQGIADSKGDLTSVLSDTMSGLAKQTMSQAALIAKAVGELFSQLSPTVGGIGNVGQTQVTQARAALASLASDLASTFDESATSLWNAVVANNAGTANGAQRAIANQFATNGQNYGAGSQASLDASFVLGAGNINGFLGAAEKIRDFVQTAASSGAPLEDVIRVAQQYRDQLVFVAAQYNANGDAVQGLLSQLGLLDPQLADFINQAGALRAAASTPATPTPDKDTKAEDDAKQAEIDFLKEQLRVIGLGGGPAVEVNVYPPYGDPEAIGLGAANRVAAALGI